MVETISHVMGPYASPVQSELFLDQGRAKSPSGASPEITALKGKRALFGSEVEGKRNMATARCKLLSGGDTLNGRDLYSKDEIRFTPTHTLFLQTNDLPHANSEDSAFWERTMLIPFKMSFVRRKPQADWERPADIHLKDRLKEEASGILAWLVRGCLQWQAQGLNPPLSVTEASAQYRRKEDLLAEFIDECIIIDPKLETKAADLYACFSRWWEKAMSTKIPTPKKFGTLFGKKFIRNENARPKTYFGCGIRAESEF